MYFANNFSMDTWEWWKFLLFYLLPAQQAEFGGLESEEHLAPGWLPVWWTVSESILRAGGGVRIYLNKTKSGTRYTASSFQFGQLCAIITAGFWFSFRFPWILVNAFDYVTRTFEENWKRTCRVRKGICIKIYPVNPKIHASIFVIIHLQLKKNVKLVPLLFFFLSRYVIIFE